MSEPAPAYRHRQATLADLPAIVAIYNSTVASREVTADTEPVSVESRLHWFHEHNPERRPLWVIEAAGVGAPGVGAAGVGAPGVGAPGVGAGDAAASPPMLGWISYSNFYGRPAYAGTAELSVYIAEAWRGKGLGRYCLEQAIAHAPHIGVHTLLGFIFGHNQPSLALFDKFGFATWANLPKVATLDGVERDLIILGKRVA